MVAYRAVSYRVTSYLVKIYRLDSFNPIGRRAIGCGESRIQVRRGNEKFWFVWPGILLELSLVR